MPSGYTLSPLNVGSNDAIDNDFYSSSAWTDYISVTAGSVNNSNDAGLVPVAPPVTPVVSVSDAAAAEGNSGTSDIAFTVRLSSASQSTVTVNYATSDGTATITGNDYQAASGTVTFNPGVTTATVIVKAVGDTVDEKNETFTLTLSNPAGATLGRAVATGTVADDDPTPVYQQLAAGASAIARDYTGSGSFTELVTSPSNLSVRKFSPPPGGSIPADERSILEFPVGSINRADVSSSYLSLTVASYTSSSTNIEIYGYAGNGLATLSDATASAVLLGSFHPNSLGQYSIPLNLAEVLPLLGGTGSYVGLRLSGLNPMNTQFYGTSSTYPPKLVLGVSTTPALVNVADAAVNEGDYANVTVSLSQAVATTATVRWSTYTGGSYGTATAGTDYISSGGLLTFQPGETTKTVQVPTVGDTVDDSGETFTIILTDATGGTQIGDGYGLVTINDVPNPTPGVSISDASVVEGNAGTTTQMVFTVSLSVPSQNTVTMNYATGAQSFATSPADYQGTDPNNLPTLSFAPGETSKTISVTVNGDNIRESLGQSGETFRVTLSNIVNATLLDGIGIGTIIDDDPAPAVSVGDLTVTEGNSGTTTANVPITLSNPADVAITVNVFTSAGTAFPNADSSSRAQA